MIPEPSAIAILGWVARARAIQKKGFPRDGEEFLIANGAPERALRILKSPIGSGPPTDTTLAPFGITLGQWSDTARTRSAFYRILADGAFTRAPAYRYLGMMSSAPSAGVVAEGKAVPVSKIVLNNIQLIPEKVAAVIVCSDVLLREVGAAGQQLFNRELLGAISDAVDAAFLAKISSGVSAITSTGPTADLRAALAVANFFGAGARPYWIGHPSVGALASTLLSTKTGNAFAAASATGGELANLPFLVSTGVPTGSLYLIDASGIAVDAVPPEVSVTSEADIQMDTAPTEDSTVPTAATMVNMFATNNTALQATAYFACQVLRASAITVISGISNSTWSAT